MRIPQSYFLLLIVSRISTFVFHRVSSRYLIQLLTCYPFFSNRSAQLLSLMQYSSSNPPSFSFHLYTVKAAPPPPPSGLQTRAVLLSKRLNYHFVNTRESCRCQPTLIPAAIAASVPPRQPSLSTASDHSQSHTQTERRYTNQSPITRVSGWPEWYTNARIRVG